MNKTDLKQRKMPPPQPYQDDDEKEEPYGNPADLKNESPAESLGRAITAPVRDAAEKEEQRQTGKH